VGFIEMRILVSTGIFPNRNDVNRGVYIFKQADALSKTCEVRAIAPVPYFPGVIMVGDYAKYSQIPKEDRLGDIHVLYPRYLVIPKIFRFLHGFTLFLSVVSVYRKVISEFKPDVIMSFFAYPYGFASVVLARLFGLPVVVSCRGSDINWLAKSFLRGKLITWALRKCQKVISVSGALKNEIVKLGVPEENVVVVPNGIEIEKFHRTSKSEARKRLGLDPNRSLALCVSRLSFEKGLDVLVESFNHLRRDDVDLIVVGDGAKEQELKEQAAKLDLNGRVRFVGAKPHDEVPVWINASDLVVLSSRTEGFPNVLLEALACGRPVVASRVGGVPEIITSDQIGRVVDSEDPRGLAEGIRSSLAREWDEERLCEAARSRTWDNVAKDLLEIVTEYVDQ
jgi:glycosyltransferase involved in cell wall biosynthesis